MRVLGHQEADHPDWVSNFGRGGLSACREPSRASDLPRDFRPKSYLKAPVCRPAAMGQHHLRRHNPAYGSIAREPPLVAVLSMRPDLAKTGGWRSCPGSSVIWCRNLPKSAETYAAETTHLRADIPAR